MELEHPVSCSIAIIEFFQSLPIFTKPNIVVRDMMGFIHCRLLCSSVSLVDHQSSIAQARSLPWHSKWSQCKKGVVDCYVVIILAFGEYCCNHPRLQGRRWPERKDGGSDGCWIQQMAGFALLLLSLYDNDYEAKATIKMVIIKDSR